MKEEKKSLNRHFQTFRKSLLDIRMKLALVNGVLLILAVGFNGTESDYLILGCYLAWNIMCMSLPVLRLLARGIIGYPVLLLDLIMSCYMIFRTGGLASDLYGFLFLPLLAVIVRCEYTGIILWCTLLSMVYTCGVWFADGFELIRLLVRIVYLYLAGIFGGFLIRSTYKSFEEMPNQPEPVNFDLQRLNKFYKEIAASSDVEQIFSETLKIIHENNQTPMAAIMIFDMKGELRIIDSFGWTEDWLYTYQRYPLSKYSLTLAPLLVFKKPILCQDINKHDELIQAFKGIPIRSLFVYPLVINDELIGTVMITDDRQKNILEKDSQILMSIVNQTGIAIQNTLHLNEEKQKADTDGLTGLFNRRYFNEKIEMMVGEVRHSGDYLSFILLDVDNFKKYNDTYGHPAGDSLLKKVAKVIEEAVREGDIVARYGGEEFAVILKSCHNELALQIAERVRRSVERIADLNCSITVSLGVGTIPDHAFDVKSLLDYSDQSLYKAKQTGKNRVCCGY